MPTPSANESKNDWMGRCVPMLVEEGRKQDQAVAICMSKWERRGKEREDRAAGSTFTVFKDKSGAWRWFSVYSNKFRDEDNPPEIIASMAHKEFVEAVDSGAWPMPELWIWHVRGTVSGRADWVAYDDSGFSLASGTFDEGKEHVAEALSKEADLLTSHGMPAREIHRDTEDSTIITRYRTAEISPLPREWAANKYGTAFASFAVLPKEADMALPDKKRPFLERIFGKDGVDELEQNLADGAKELEAQGVESKEESQPEAAEVETPPTATEAEPEPAEDAEDAQPKEAAPDAPEPAPEPRYVTHDELEQVFTDVLAPIVAELRGARLAAAEAEKELKELRETVARLQQDDEQRLKDVIEVTPAASLAARITSAIGSDEALVDGRTSLAKSKPAQSDAPENGPTFVPLINEFLAKNGYGGLGG